MNYQRWWLRVHNLVFIYVAQKMYPSKLGLSSDDAMSLWLQFMCTDEAGMVPVVQVRTPLLTRHAASHCSIAVMQTCNDFFIGNGASSQMALYHLSQTFTLVNKRLQSNEALSDSTLGIILLLMLQEQMRKAKLETGIHYEGLRKLIELRGGLCQLEGNLPLLLKICKLVFLLPFVSSSNQPLAASKNRYNICPSKWRADDILSRPHVRSA